MVDDTTRQQHAPWRRITTGVGRMAVTLAFVGVAVGAGVMAHGALSARAVQGDGPLPAPRTSIVPQVLHMEHTISLERRFTGQFEAPQEVALAFEEGGTIATVLVREGDRVEAGVVVATLDTRLLDADRVRLQASRAALAAQVELARRTNDRQTALLAEGHVTRQRVDETSLQLAQLNAAIAEIDAGIAALDVRLSKAEIRAPFAGVIGARVLDAGAVAGPGAAVVTLLEGGPARFRVGLAPDLAARLVPGIMVEIETASGPLAARLARLTPDLDATTRTRVALFDLAQSAVAPPSRTTGEVVISDEITAEGAWVPVSALRQGPRGSWVILTVDGTGDGATIQVEAAEVLHLDADRAFVRGSFADGTLFVPAGNHRIVPGERVRVISVAEAG